ncbi:MAG: hypothetical protein RBS56_02865 [Candidatus Gracilibacteria bacterium]|jgi:hypothetical protein|nr:hypothetical protein [Candidatus Gracilibacteria bacterium]
MTIIEMTKTVCKSRKVFSLSAILSSVILASFLSVNTIFADEILIYSNEVFEMDSNSAILDADDTGGDVVLQFGNALSESLYWDSLGLGFVLTDDLDVQGDLDVDGNANIGGTANIEGNSLILDFDNSGGNIDLIFGQALNEYLRYNGAYFTFSDDLLMPDDNRIYFRDGNQSIGSSAVGELDLIALNEINVDTPLVDLNGNLDLSGDLIMGGDITGATIDGDFNTLLNIPISSLSPVEKKLIIDMSELTIEEDGTNNLADLYLDSETGVDPHRFYVLKTSQTSMQDLTIKLKVRLPSGFDDFSSVSNDIGFWYKNTGVNSTDSKIDIRVQDADGDDAFPAVDGQNLFSNSWTSYVDEFSEVAFNPSANDYIYITIKAYGSFDGGDQSPFVGELALTYFGY